MNDIIGNGTCPNHPYSGTPCLICGATDQTNKERNTTVKNTLENNLRAHIKTLSEKAQPKHSPLPWSIRSEDEITADDKTQVCTFFACPQSDANSAYIVKACNQYPKLVRVLEAINNLAGDYLDEDKEYEAETFVHDVIELAEGCLSEQD